MLSISGSYNVECDLSLNYTACGYIVFRSPSTSASVSATGIYLHIACDLTFPHSLSTFPSLVRVLHRDPCHPSIAIPRSFCMCTSTLALSDARTPMKCDDGTTPRPCEHWDLASSKRLHHKSSADSPNPAPSQVTQGLAQCPPTWIPVPTASAAPPWQLSAPLSARKPSSKTSTAKSARLDMSTQKATPAATRVALSLPRVTRNIEPLWPHSPPRRPQTL